MESTLTIRFLACLLAAAMIACQATQPFQSEVPPVKQMVVNGTNLAYVEQGQGEVVLFIHGANGDWRTWDELRPIIATRYRFVSISRRYHQPNPWPGDGKDYSVQLHVNDVAAFISALGEIHPSAHNCAVKVSEILRLLHEDGWLLVVTRGSHRQFKHPSKSGRVTVPGKPSDELAPGTLNSIRKQAGFKK